MQQSSNYDIMANIKSSQHLKLDVASLKADIAIASKTVTLSSLEILDDFQVVSMKIKVLKGKGQVECGGRMKQVLQGMKYLTQWSTALRTYFPSGQRTHVHLPSGKNTTWSRATTSDDHTHVRYIATRTHKWATKASRG